MREQEKLGKGCAAWAGALMAAILVCGPGARAQDLGGISVSPKRVVFEGRTRSAEVMLINRANEPATYRISFENRRMKEDGSLEVVTAPDPGQNFADNMIRYSPRQVVVPAGSSQTVRLLLRLPAELGDGEYRSHMVFSSVPAPSAGQTIDPESLKPGEISVALIPTYVITIPVIVRAGAVSATASLSDFTLAKAGAGLALALKISRQGNRSTYGDVLVTRAGGDDPVALIRGISVYTPNDSRTIAVPFVAGKMPTPGTKLQIVYRAPDDDGKTILAETEFTMP
jgi:hypothetical protein